VATVCPRPATSSTSATFTSHAWSRCGRCERHGRLHLARLIAQHGADAALPDVLRAIAGDCPKREAFNVHDRCDVYVPVLAASNDSDRDGMTGLASPGVLHPDWYKEVPAPSVDPALPGLYEWRIAGVGCYIGQYTHVRRPRREYGLNVGRILAHRPYRKSKPEGFRLIHHELAKAAQAGIGITLELLENQTSKDDRNCRERELIAERRALALVGGLPVLNAAP
jgi:hypothetical protein